MKKLIAILAFLLLSTSAMAQHYHGGHYRGGPGWGGGWVAPLIIGGITGAVIANSQRPVIVDQQPQVIIQQPQPQVLYYRDPTQQYYSCVVQVKDSVTGIVRNEVATCVK